MACVSRERPCLAVPPAESPSTMKSSAFAGSRSWQSASLPGRLKSASAPLRRARSRALRAATRARGLEDLPRDRAGRRGVLFQMAAQPLVEEPLDETANVAGAELGLGLPFELRLWELHRNDRGETLADVVARRRLGGLLAVLRLAREVAVERAREAGAEADQVRATLDGVDVVREAVDGLVVGLVVLDRDLDRDRNVLPLAWEGPLSGDVDRWLVERCAGAIQVLHEGDDPTLVAEVVALPAALVLDHDAQARVEEGELAQALREDVEGEIQRREGLRIGVEGDPGARLVGGADLFEGGIGLAAAIGLPPYASLAADLELEAIRERVDHRDADAVQAPRDLVGRVVELSTGVQPGHHDLGGGDLLGRVLFGRDPAAVVDHRDAAVLMDRDLDLATEPGHRLVDRVVDHLVDEMVQTLESSGPDVHRRALANRLEALENLDGTGVVAHGLVVPERTINGRSLGSTPGWGGVSTSSSARRVPDAQTRVKSSGSAGS
jgi:hypothetical protein